jgi:hypothetical protein
MPTQFTHCAPGHHCWSGALAALVELTVHTHVALDAPSSRKICTMCRQAATKLDGEA